MQTLTCFIYRTNLQCVLRVYETADSVILGHMTVCLLHNISFCPMALRVWWTDGQTTLLLQ